MRTLLLFRSSRMRVMISSAWLRLPSLTPVPFFPQKWYWQALLLQPCYGYDEGKHRRPSAEVFEISALLQAIRRAPLTPSDAERK
jgi:hypothetical protein